MDEKSLVERRKIMILSTRAVSCKSFATSMLLVRTARFARSPNRKRRLVTYFIAADSEIGMLLLSISVASFLGCFVSSPFVLVKVQSSLREKGRKGKSDLQLFWTFASPF